MELLENRASAHQTLFNLEHRLSKNPTERSSYINFLDEYFNLGRMIPASIPSKYLLLHHHPVFKISNGGTKVRVAFNGSAPSQLKSSLNDLMLTGPKLQKPLLGLLINFRKYLVALCADVRMIYRQIRVRPQDCKYQHIFWRLSESDNILEFELTTVTHGLKSSPFLAQRVTAQLASDEGSYYPLALQGLQSSIYIDDILLTGASSVDQAKILKSELINLLQGMGFELRKWVSGHPKVLEHESLERKESYVVFNTEDARVKILGLLWELKDDNFRFHVSGFNNTPTKRNILAYVAKIYDPLGFLAPVVFHLKWFLQQLWLIKLAWDDYLPAELCTSWLFFYFRT